METKLESEALLTIPFFADLPEDQRDRVLARSRLVRFEPGETLVERGAPGCSMWVLIGGRVRVEVGGRYHDLGRGDFVGEMTVLSSKPRMRTVKALEGVDALEIDCTDVDAFLGENPGIAIQLLKSMVERLREVEERLDAWMGIYEP